MGQDVTNNDQIHNQVNIATNHGSIYLNRKTRFARRFEKLNNEVANDDRFDGIMESLKFYITSRDGIDMPTKLADGGYKEQEVIEAMRKKDKFAKRLQLNRFYESAQWIDSYLFARIKMNFEVFVLPMINAGKTKDDILREVVINVIQPVLDLINNEGENDEILNYNADDIFGMVYYLTGQCHLNWKNYDNL